jgi:NADH-quinone oxidoreductase subunit N
MLVSSAGDLIMLFLGLELISIPTYILLFIGKPSRGSEESAAKYFFLSVLSSAFLLYGFATLYGLSGEIEFAAIAASLGGATERVMWPLLPVAMIMILAGLAFKISAFPFHFYAPDVFQGTTNFNAAVLAVVPKMAGVVALVRLLVAAFPRESAVAWQLVIILAVVTMTVGNFAALWQQNIKRLMAYSSIAHAGYLLIGLAAAMGTGIGSRQGEDAVAAMVFYVVAYAAATLGTFAGIAYLSDDDESFSNVADLAGIGQGYPVIALGLAICMFSLAGIPPLAGFWGKFALFKSALDVGFLGPEMPRVWFITLCVIGALNAAAAAAYYLRIVATMYFRSSVDHSVMPVMGNLGAGAALVASVIVVVGVGLFTGWPMASAERAAQSVWYASESASDADSPSPISSVSKRRNHGLH